MIRKTLKALLGVNESEPQTRSNQPVDRHQTGPVTTAFFVNPSSGGKRRTIRFSLHRLWGTGEGEMRRNSFTANDLVMHLPQHMQVLARLLIVRPEVSAKEKALLQELIRRLAPAAALADEVRDGKSRRPGSSVNGVAGPRK